MGTKTISTTSHNQTLKLYESIEDSTECDYQINSPKINKEKNTYFHQTSSSQESQKELNNDLIQYTFIWKEGGENVKITGSFLENWKKQEPMTKNLITNFYEITLNITPGIYQFKFIIDDKWMCSKDYKINKDKNNNDNNEIDLSNYNNKMINKKITKKGNNDYSCDIPNKSDINSKAPKLPFHYTESINLNDKQFNKYHNIKNLLENDSFKNIATIPHEKLSHIMINYDDNLNLNNDKEINGTFKRISSTQRTRHKFLTVIYFSPNF